MLLSAYLRLLIFLPAILIPPCASSSPAFLMMYSAYKLKKQGDNIQPWHTPFPICNQFVIPCLVSNCCFLTCIQISQETGRWSSIPISLRIFHNLFWSTQSVWFAVDYTGFSIVSGAEVDAFLEFPCFLHDLTNAVNLISGSSAFSKPSLCIWMKPCFSLIHIWFAAAAAAAKLLQLCPTLCDPIDSSLPGSPVPGILQARTLEWVAISFSNAWKWKVKVKSLSRVRLLATPWTAACQAPLSMGFSRQEYWSGLPLPSPHLI